MKTSVLNDIKKIKSQLNDLYMSSYLFGSATQCDKDVVNDIDILIRVRDIYELRNQFKKLEDLDLNYGIDRIQINAYEIRKSPQVLNSNKDLGYDIVFVGDTETENYFIKYNKNRISVLK